MARRGVIPEPVVGAVLDDVQRRVLYRHARPADPHALASAQPGDSIRLVPGSSAEATIAVAPVGGPSE